MVKKLSLWDFGVVCLNSPEGVDFADCRGWVRISHGTMIELTAAGGSPEGGVS